MKTVNKIVIWMISLVLILCVAGCLTDNGVSEKEKGTGGDQYGLTVAEQLELARNEQSETTEAETTEEETTEAEIAKAVTTELETTEAVTAPVITPVETEAYVEPANELTYVLNANTKKIHYPGCKSVKDIKPENRVDFYGTLDEAKAMGYDPCGRCKP